MGYQIKIFQATKDDAGDIANIQTEAWVCAYPNSGLGITKEDIVLKTEEFNKQGLGRIINEISKENSKTWVAKSGDQVVGFIGVSEDGEIGRIEALHVLPNFQGQGIGTKLLNTALDYLEGSKKIAIEVVSYNKKAIKFYESFGFENTKKIAEDKIILPSGHLIEKVLLIKE